MDKPRNTHLKFTIVCSQEEKEKKQDACWIALWERFGQINLPSVAPASSASTRLSLTRCSWSTSSFWLLISSAIVTWNLQAISCPQNQKSGVLILHTCVVADPQGASLHSTNESSPSATIQFPISAALPTGWSGFHLIVWRWWLAFKFQRNCQS